MDMETQRPRPQIRAMSVKKTTVKEGTQREQL